MRLTKGTYLSGTIFFRSGVTLCLDEGATLLGSTDLKDYPHKTPAFQSLMTEQEGVTQSLIYAERVEKIALCGKGQINGQGDVDSSSVPRWADYWGDPLRSA